MWAKRLFLIISKFVPPRCGTQGPLCEVAPRESAPARAVARHPLPPLMKAFQDPDVRGGPIKSIFWTISLLAPRAEFGSVGHTAPNRIHWAASWHGGTVTSVCCKSETANMAVFGRFVSISREKRPKMAKTLRAWMQTASCPP